MATATRPTQSPPQSQPRQPYRLSLDQYHRMTECGILTKYDRVVLLDGRLYQKMTKGNPHVAVVRLVFESLRPIVPQEYMVAKEDPIALPGGPWGGDSEPEPHVLVIRGGIRDYLTRKPRPADVPLIVEVSDSTLSDDRKQLVRYAWAGIAVVWIVNLNRRTVEVYTDPSGPSEDARYGTVETRSEDDEVPVLIAGRRCGTIAVRTILP